MPKRFILASHSAGMYGAERCLLRLARNLNRRDFDPLVLLPGPGPLVDALREIGIGVQFAEIGWWMRIGSPGQFDQAHFDESLARRVEALTTTLEREGAELALSNSSVIADLALAATRRRIPHVWWLHELLGMQRDLIPLVPPDKIFSALGPEQQWGIAVSHAVRRQWSAHFPASRLRVIYNGIEHGAPTAISSNDDWVRGWENHFRLALVATLTANKGLDHLIPLAQSLRAVLPEARLAVVGLDIDERFPGLRDDLARAGLAEHVRYLGWREDVPEILQRAHLLVSMSTADAFPTVVLEAMRAGLPVVGMRSGGITEMVLDGVTGFVVPQGDIGTMVDCILQCFRSPGLRAQFGIEARNRLRACFSEERFVADVHDYLREILTAPIISRVT